MPMPLPDTRQVLAGIWIRLRILWPIIGAVVFAMFTVGVNPTPGQKLAAGLIVLLALALDAVRHPGGTRR